ncbi:MAG: DNA primase [Planctomycetota bacterium]|nr:MAG: DNA primase [Planctomycetota bacterium]
MGKFVGEEQLRRIKEAVDLVDVMGDYAPPQKAGSQFKVCCPFHQERTPSCYIYPDQQTYHCFGCGAHGDIITLVREQEGLDFVDAVEYLARRANIQLVFEERGPGETGPNRSERENLLALMAFASDFYQRMLQREDSATEAREYLQQRRIGADLAKRFGLGWAPGRGSLCAAARQKGFTPEQLIACNLAIDREGTLRDRFYERVMFPIADRFGQPIAFSGRILPAAEAQAKAEGRSVGKYINSSDTPLYHKSEVVWNLHQARAAARKEGRVVIMEGPTDVMAASAVGLDACVAVLGTALTSQHARQLANTVGGTGKVVLLFDGDSAGQNNAVKAVSTFLSAGIPCRVAVMEAGHDPAELVANGGRTALDRVLRNERSDIDHLLRSLAPLPHTLEPRERVSAVDHILDALRGLRDIDVRRGYLEELGAWFRIEVPRLERRLRDSSESTLDGPGPSPAVAADGPGLAQEDVCLHLLVRYPELRPLAFDDWGLEPRHLPTPWDGLLAELLAQPHLPPAELINTEVVREDPPLSAAVHRWLRSEEGRGRVALDRPQELLADMVAFLIERGLDRELAELDQQREQAQRDGDVALAMDLFRQRSDIQRQQRGLRERNRGAKPA